MLPTTQLSALGKEGLYHLDIIGGISKGVPRGPFKKIAIQGVPQYPMLWSHNAKQERGLVVPPDSEGEVRPGCDVHAIEVWKTTASQLHFNLDFQINSQSLTACLTPAKAIGGRAWPNFIPAQDEWTLPLVLWSNTTLGLLAFWWDRNQTATGPCNSHNHSTTSSDGVGPTPSQRGTDRSSRGHL